MDDGYVIPRLNENWTFAGATPMEWCSGLVAGLIFQELFISNLGRSIPIVLVIIVGTPMLLAMIRKSYPDEERGVRNHAMSLMGVEPTDIPSPSKLQPVWSGMPMRKMKEKCDFVQLGLEEVLFNTEDEDYVNSFMDR